MEFFYDEAQDEITMATVYEHLGDEQSKKIYRSRSLYSMTNKSEEMREMIRESVVGKYLTKKINSVSKGKKIILFGFGTWGKAIIKFFPEIDISYVVDNKKAGNKVDGIDIVSLNDVIKLEDGFFIVSILFEYRTVYSQLIKAGIVADDILLLGDFVSRNQYFDLDVLPCVRGEEIFVDAGGYKGETTQSFAEWCNGAYRKIYIFEPYSTLFEECRKNLCDLPNVNYIQAGLWHEKSFARLEVGSDTAATRCFSSSNPEEGVQLVTIDDIIEDHEVTFIKMDIEGAELNALIGAEKTIRKSRPKLAISVYHKRRDIWEIPMLLLKYNPDYRFYLRCYSFTGNDTVLYAI